MPNFKWWYTSPATFLAPLIVFQPWSNSPWSQTFIFSEVTSWCKSLKWSKFNVTSHWIKWNNKVNAQIASYVHLQTSVGLNADNRNSYVWCKESARQLYYICSRAENNYYVWWRWCYCRWKSIQHDVALSRWVEAEIRQTILLPYMEWYSYGIRDALSTELIRSYQTWHWKKGVLWKRLICYHLSFAQ